MEPITLTWWTWLIVGLMLMAAELLLPAGFYLFFFGVGGVATAFLAALGVSAFPVQGLAFIGISLVCVVLLRKPLLAKVHFRNKTHTVDSMVGETAKALEAIAPHAVGRVEMRGTCWSALNTGSDLIPLDVRCRVEKVEGLTLHVKL
jgi:inner membrane protein